MGRIFERRRWGPACVALAGLLLLAGATTAAETNPTAEKLYAALNKADPAIKAATARWAEGDQNTAIRYVLADMQQQAKAWPADFLTPLPEWNDATRQEATAALTGTFTLQGVTGTAPRLAEGGFDWTWRGPNNDPEFAWFLNRQHHIPALFVAWRETKDPRYRTALNEQLRDWLRQSPRPGHYSFSSAWRALEVARRMEEAWMPLLLAPQASEALDDDVLAGLLADIPEHAQALRDTHSFSGNHLITEMTGLTAMALVFPEFKDAPQWLEYAVTQAQAEAAKEIYPDGAETELSNWYQQVVLQELQRLVDMLAAAGRAKELAALRPLVERGWNFFAHTLSPLGPGPLDNDSSIGDDASLVRAMAAKYHRPDWLFIATQGQAGTMPAGVPAEYFPYAGLAVMRNGWDAKAEWAYFDMGPYGSDHQHADRLHLTIGGGGREFLVDDGRYNYQPGPWRDYFTGPRGHNIVLLDGQGPLRPPETVRTPLETHHDITAKKAYFEATAPFAGNTLQGQGPAYQTRSVNYFPGKYWVVTDELVCAGPHKVEALWHFHPDCTVKQDGNLLYTDDAGKANIGLEAVEAPGVTWRVDLIRGREEPTPQGWYSPQFNQRVPATCASLTTLVSGPKTFTWIIWIAPPGHDVRKERPEVDLWEPGSPE